MIRKCIVTLSTLLCFLLAQQLSAQIFSDLNAFGRANFSPTHLVAKAGIEKGILEKQSLLLSGGFDLFNMRGGEKDVEQGWGATGALGFRHYFGARRSGLFAEAEAGVFFRTYNWKDNFGFANEKTGRTSTLTVFPNLQIGYSFESLNFWDFSPMIGLGYETHLKVSGKSVSNGIMPFVGVQVGYWFR